jgi:hypothetical protein
MVGEDGREGSQSGIISEDGLEVSQSGMVREDGLETRQPGICVDDGLEGRQFGWLGKMVLGSDSLGRFLEDLAERQSGKVPEDGLK